MAEGNSATVRVTLSADPERTVTIPITKTEQGGSTSSDYSGVPAGVTFNTGETSKTFTFNATDDSVDDDGESVKLGLGALPSRVTKGTTEDSVVSITDDDVPEVTVKLEDKAEEEAPGLLRTSDARILRIEPSIRGVSLRLGKPVRLSVEVYGIQNIRGDSLADRPNVTFEWTAEELTHQPSLGVGRFSESLSSGQNRPENGLADDRRALYNAPVVPGRYLVTAMLDPGTECVPKRAGETEEDVSRRCSAVFDVTVMRFSQAKPTLQPPRNPEGDIPQLIVDENGTNYEVFTPEGGGTFAGDTSTMSAGPGVVPNGEILGIRISEGGSASNEGKTYQRHSLRGSWYRVTAVDASAERVSYYALNGGVDVCIPLPSELRSNIADLVLIVVNADDSLTVLASRVKIGSAAMNVCDNLSSVPATIAVGSLGVPSPLPSEMLEAEDGYQLPDTGGAATSSTDALIWTLLIGLIVAAFGFAAIRMQRRTMIGGIKGSQPHGVRGFEDMT